MFFFSSYFKPVATYKIFLFSSSEVTTICVVSTHTEVFGAIDVSKFGKKKLEHNCKSACYYIGSCIVHVLKNIYWKPDIIHLASSVDVKYFFLFHSVLSLHYLFSVYLQEGLEVE